MFDDPPTNAPVAPSPNSPAWSQLARSVTAAAPEVPSELSTEQYVWLVWAQVQRNCAQLDTGQIAALDKALSRVRIDQRWVDRYVEIAARDVAGLPLTGGWRTQWLARQRRQRAESSLPVERVALMELLEGFSWNPVEARWNAAFDRITAFTDQHGRIPTRSDDLGMANWLAGQRFALRAHRLPTDRARSLARLPGWMESLSSTRARQPWEQRCAQLRLFLTTHQRYPRVTARDAEECVLARWVTTQREQARRDGLSAYRTAALSALPDWRWTARDTVWDHHYRQLCVETLRGVPIGTDHALYTWVVAQRRRHRDGRLSAEQTRLLQSMNLLGSRVSPAA